MKWTNRKLGLRNTRGAGYIFPYTWARNFMPVINITSPTHSLKGAGYTSPYKRARKSIFCFNVMSWNHIFKVHDTHFHANR